MDEKEREQHRRSNRGVAPIILGVAALVVVLVVGGGVGVISKLFSGGDVALSRRVMTALNGALGTDSTRFVCDRVYGTLFRGAVLDHPRLLVRTRMGDVTWAEAKRARVDYDLWTLLVSTRRDLTVSVDSLRIALVRDSTHTLVMPKFRKGSGKSSLGETRIHLALSKASLRFVEERVAFEGLDGKGLVTSASSGTTVLVERLEGIARGASAQSPVRMSGMVAFQDSLWRLDPARVEFPKTRVTASGEWDTRRSRLREGTLHFEPLVLAEVLPLFEVNGIDGTLRGDVDLAGAVEEGSASGCLSGDIEGETLDTLLVNARLAKDGFLVDHLQTRLRGATVTGRGRIDRRGALDAFLDFRDANPVSIPWWTAPAGTPQGSVAGSARLRVTRGKPHAAIRVEGTLARGHVGKLPIDGGAFVVHAPPLGGLFLDSLVVDTPGARVIGAGTFGADGTLRANATANVTDFGRMGSLLAPMEPREGRGRITAVFAGTTKAPTMDLRGAAARPRFQSGLGADSVTFQATGVLAPTLNVRGAVRVGRLAAKSRPLGDVVAMFEGGRDMRVPSFVLSAHDTTLRLQGNVSFAEGGVSARVDSLRLDAGALRAVALQPAQVTFAKERLHAAPLVLDLQPGHLDADLDWDVSAGRIDLRGTVSDLDLARLRNGAADPAQALDGRVRAQFLLSGASSDPDVTLRGVVSQPRFKGMAADSLVARLDYAPGVLNIEDLRLVRGASNLRVSGTLRSRATLENWLRGVETKDRGWAAATTLALEAAADSFGLAALAPADTTLRTLAGDATFRARIGGSFAAPAFDLSGRIPGFRYRGLGGDVTAFEGAYRDRQLNVERWELRQDKGTTTVAGTLPLDLAVFADKRLLRDEPLRLTVKANGTDFATIAGLSPVVATSAGALSGNAEITGTPAHPKMTGVVTLRDGRIRFAGRYEVLEGINVDGTFDEERLNLTKMEAREGKKGRLTGTGTWRWAGLGNAMPPGSVGPPGEYSLDVKATDCVVTDREYYLFQFTGAFRIVNGRTASGVVKPRITGSGTVSRGELAVNLATPIGEPPPPLPFLYDVTADFPRQFKYKQLDTEVELAGTLRMRNEGDRDIVLGDLTVKGGQFYFLTRKFSNLTGDVKFNNPARMDPMIAIDASTRVRRPGAQGGEDHDVNLGITGRASQLQIVPWDTDGTDRSVLWRELSVGQFASSKGLSDSRNDPLAGVTFGSLPIQGYVFRGVERLVESSGWLDTVDINAGTNTGTEQKTVAGPIDLGSVGAGKYVTRDLFLKYSQDFTGKSEQQITAEYRMTRHLLLRGSQIQKKPASSGLTEQQYNIDLKIRVEY